MWCTTTGSFAEDDNDEEDGRVDGDVEIDENADDDPDFDADRDRRVLLPPCIPVDDNSDTDILPLDVEVDKSDLLCLAGDTDEMLVMLVCPDRDVDVDDDEDEENLVKVVSTDEERERTNIDGASEATLILPALSSFFPNLAS